MSWASHPREEVVASSLQVVQNQGGSNLRVGPDWVCICREKERMGDRELFQLEDSRVPNFERKGCELSCQLIPAFFSSSLSLSLLSKRRW